MERNQGGQGQGPSRATRGICSGICFVIVPVSLLIWACMDFRYTWAEECSYDEKIWVIVSLSTPIANTVMVAGGCFAQVCLSLVTLFQLCWWLYGIKPVLVDESCNDTVHNWGLAMWFLPIAILGFFCLLLCCLACCVAIMVHNQEEGGLNPTPESVFSNLEQKKFSEIRPFLSESSPQNMAAAAQPGGTNRGWEYLRSISRTTGVPMPNVIEKHIPAEAPASAIVGQTTSEPRCAICLCDFEDEEVLTVLPCDVRHCFHPSCIHSWLSKSQECPICRRNIVAMISPV